MFRRLPSKFGKLGTAVVAMTLLLTGCSPEYVVLNPAGPVGKTELNLIILSTVLVAIVVIPVLILLAFIVYRYRDKPNRKAPYSPEWVDSKVLEYVWWGIPVVIIAILGAFTWKTTFSLQKAPESNVKPITIQVVSLDWKWLFQYPDQKIATVNYCEIPAGVPVQFELTSDAPMNSFWVPQLGGQEYTMPGMAMRLWLQADKTGTFQGYGANFTGAGFAHMKFDVKATSQADFDAWVNKVKTTSPALTTAGYQDLKKQSVAQQTDFSAYPSGLFQDILKQNGGGYMHGMGTENSKSQTSNSNDMSGMNMNH